MVPAWSEQSEARRWIAAALVAALGLVATGALVGLLAFTAARDAKAQAERAAEVIADQLRSTIALAEQTSNSLAAYVTGQAGDLRTVRTKEYMKALYSDSSFVKSLSLAPDNRIRYVVPVRGNETAVGLDLTTVPEQWEPIKDIIDRGEPALIGPIELVQGGRGFAYRVPIFLPFEGYWGLATTVIDADEFLSAATKVPGMDPNRVAVRDVSSGAKSGGLLWGDAAVLGEAPLVRSVRAVDTDWEVAVTPAPINLVPLIAVAMVGAIASGFLGIVTYWAVAYRQRRAELAHRLNSLSEQTPGLLFQLRLNSNGTTQLPFASDRLHELFGLGAAAVRDDAGPMWDRVDPADRDGVLASLETSALHGEPWHHRLRMTDASGQQRWFQVDAAPERDRTDNIVMHGYLADVTDEVASDAQLKISASVFASTRDGVIIMTTGGVITDVNDGFIFLTGHPRDEVIGRTLPDLSLGLTPGAVFAEMDSSLSRDGFWRGELITRNPQGIASAHAATVTAVIGDDTAPGHRVAVLSALSSLREDLVTGLPGRQIFDDRLLHSIETSRLSGDAFALITLGIDHFRDINASLGYRVGDVALREVADRLRQALPDGTTIARLGGDEFVVLLTDIGGPEEVDTAALLLLSSLRQPFELDQRAWHLTASIGIAIFPADGDSANDLLTAAEQAQRSARDSGRNRHSFFTAEMQSRARERARLTEDLRTAIAKGQLHLEFQPIVRLRTDRISKAEALVRWNHPELGVISPAVFIPLAESSGQILALSDWIFAQAVDFIVQARHIDADFTVSVNLSPLDIEGPGDHASRRIAYMNESGVPSTAIIAEITESSLLHRDSQTLHNLARYRTAGIEFAIDDFGTGYSSLAYLQSLDVSYLKIDQSFTRGLTPGSENLALCAAIIDMGHALDLKVIAEGVETEVARALLTSADCDFGQGYLFSRPVPSSQLLTQLRSLHPDPRAAQA